MLINSVNHIYFNWWSPCSKQKVRRFMNKKYWNWTLYTKLTLSIKHIDTYIFFKRCCLDKIRRTLCEHDNKISIIEEFKYHWISPDKLRLIRSNCILDLKKIWTSIVLRADMHVSNVCGFYSIFVFILINILSCCILNHDGKFVHELLIMIISQFFIVFTYS